MAVVINYAPIRLNRLCRQVHNKETGLVEQRQEASWGSRH